MPFLRLTRDQRGYENTFLLDAQYPGERPRVLYWYRSAPGVRVGRPPLDEDAIRAIEERYPEIEFDWPHILESSAMMPPEVEKRPERRRKPQRAREDEVETAPAADAMVADVETEAPVIRREPVELIAPTGDQRPIEPAPPVLEHDILQQLVGREIASRLRARYADIRSRIDASTAPQRDAWRTRAAQLNPDAWLTPEDILRGVQNADQLFDELRREVAAGS